MNQPVDRSLVSQLLLTGSALAVVGNVLHPVVPPGVTTEAFLQEVQGSAIWEVIHLVIAVAILLLVTGVALLSRVLAGTPGHSLAMAAGVFAVVGGSIFIVQIGAIDGAVVSTLAAQLAAGGGDPVVASAEAWLAIDIALLGLSVLFLFGATFLTLGWALRKADAFSPWIRWTAVGSGAAGLLIGALLFLGIADQVTFYAFRLVALAATVVGIGLGLQVRRPVQMTTAPPTVPAG